MMVGAPDEQPIPGIVAADLEAVDHVHALAALQASVDEGAQFAGIVLGVAVGVEHPLLARGGKTAAQGRAVAEVARVVDDAHVRRMNPGEFVEQGAGVIGAAVVDDDDLVVLRALTQGHQGGNDHRGDGAAVVVRGEKSGDAGKLSNQWHLGKGSKFG